MRERPLAAGLQDQAANRLELLWSRARVVSVKEKARTTCQVRVGKTSASEPFDEASKTEGDVKTEKRWLSRDKCWGNLSTASAASGV